MENLKKLISVLLIAVMANFTIVSATHDTNYRAVTDTVDYIPKNCETFNLHTVATNELKDTLLTTRCNYYGPYQLAMSEYNTMAKYLVIVGDLITGTSPTMAVDFQILKTVTKTNAITDTNSSWVAACTLGAAAITCKVDLSSYAGKAIVIRVNNYDGTTCAIPSNLWIGLKQDVGWIKK